jgi:hypothetical protein
MPLKLLNATPLLSPHTDNKAAAERWLASLQAAGLTVVLPRDLGGGQQYSSSSSREDAGREADGQLQDRWACAQWCGQGVLQIVTIVYI